MDLDAVTWLVDEPTDGPLLRLQWLETSGAPCEKSEKRGFGSVLIERSVARELGDHASLDFAAEFVSCVLTLPLRADVKPG